ncbi:MAG TPA: hypothetical protein VF510_22595 [Ktedonobacterales bacterium]
MVSNELTGAVAGAAGTVALDVATYLDMAIRGRSSSELPANVAGGLAERLGIHAQSITGQSSQAQSRRSGLGALLGYATGVGLGVAYGALRPRLGRFVVRVAGAVLGIAARAASDVPAVALGKTDLRSWGVSGWIADLVPHLVYGYVTALCWEALTRETCSASATSFHAFLILSSYK